MKLTKTQTELIQKLAEKGRPFSNWETSWVGRESEAWYGIRERKLVRPLTAEEVEALQAQLRAEVEAMRWKIVAAMTAVNLDDSEQDDPFWHARQTADRARKLRELVTVAPVDSWYALTDKALELAEVK